MVDAATVVACRKLRRLSDILDSSFLFSWIEHSGLQDALAVRIAFFYFGDRVCAFVSVLDVRRDLPLAIAEQLQSCSKWSFALAPRHIRTLVFLSVFDVDGHGAAVILLEERQRIVTGCREVSYIQIEADPFGFPHGCLKTLRFCEFVGVGQIVMTMHPYHHFVLRGHGSHTASR